MACTIRSTVIVGALAVSLSGRLHAQASVGPVRPATCPKALQKYSSFAEVPIPHDTLPRPRMEGTYPSKEAMEQARLEQMAARGATGYVIETQVQSTSGGMATQTMTRVTPVFVPKDAARVRSTCTARP